MDFDRQRKKLIEQIINIKANDFEALALSLFRFQYRYNSLYAAFVDCLNVNIDNVLSIQNIPFLPISFFKTHEVKTGSFSTDTIFSSSGTSGQINSKHHVADVQLYEKISIDAFNHFYCPIEDICILALLPSYLERPDSSLVAMCSSFIKRSKYAQSGFFLNDLRLLDKTIKKLTEENVPTILLGVSYALLDYAEEFHPNLSSIIVMETGGMKGRREELTKEELHRILKLGFHVETIHAEYGMTELLSQAYSKGDGLFFPAPTMKVLTAEITDPLCVQQFGKMGTIQVVDLANIDSCAFVATQDIGICYENNGFEIKGRLDNSDIRGCNLMAE
ncbi:MAG: acyl transferase [Saprospiraceae bacterium]